MLIWLKVSGALTFYLKNLQFIFPKLQGAIHLQVH